MSELDLALPPLHGSADVLHAVCAGLAQVAARLDDTFVAREGREGWGLARAWAGPAFEAARSEAAVTARTIERVARGLEPAAAAVDTYAAALADARRRVLALREEWERGRQEHRRARAEAVSLAEDPVLGVLSSLARLRAADLEWQRLRSELRGRHTGVAERLTASGDQAAVVVRAWFGEGPGADAADAAGMRGALLAELPVTAGTLQRSAARDLIANLITRAGRPVEQWGEPEGDLVASLGDAVRDPLVAQALMERMPPTLLASFVARLRAHIASVSGEGHGWRTQFDDALNTLGAAFVTVTAQRPWEFLDTAAAAWMRSWQHRWFDHLRRTGPSIVGDRLDDPPFRGFTALGVLLDHAGGSVPGVTPGVAFARTVGLAMVDADRISDDYPPQPRLPAVQGSGAEGVDVMAALLSSLRGAPDAASALLLGRLGNGQLVVHYLAGERLTRGVGGPPPPAAEALAAVLAATATGSDEQSVSIAGAALDGFGHAAETAGGILGGGDAVLAFEQQLQGLRYVMADLLSVHPDAIWTTINDPVNAPSWLSAPGDEQPWAILGTGGWTVRVLNRSRLAAVIGELGKDRLVPGLATAGPPTAPAMAHLLNSVIASETARLAEALSTGDLDERHAGIIRLGQVTGFVLEAARAGVIAVQERADVSAAERQALVDRIASSLSLPATLRKSIPTALAGRTLDLVRKAVIWVGYGDTTVGSAARAELNAGAVHARLESELRSLGWELVSTSGWWDPADDPLAWVQAHPGVSFCSADGRPLPLASMTAEQRERFLTWSQDVPAFTTVPSAIVGEVQEGARAVRTAIAAR